MSPALANELFPSSLPRTTHSDEFIHPNRYATVYYNTIASYPVLQRDSELIQLQHDHGLAVSIQDQMNGVEQRRPFRARTLKVLSVDLRLTQIQQLSL